MKIHSAFAFLLTSASFRKTLGFSLNTLSTRNNLKEKIVFSFSLSNQEEDWNGEVVSNSDDGRIRGCTTTQVEGSLTDWEISIDGQEADLGKFSEAIYRKIIVDAKQERFQGFRPGTIPPHLISAYIGFSIDECAREATLEAMQQQNIKPFEDARNDFEFDSISILPPQKKKKKKKKNKNVVAIEQPPVPEVPEEPQWLTFGTFKEAISAGWKPGQTFSFVARNVKGQQLLDSTDATPIGGPSSSIL